MRLEGAVGILTGASRGIGVHLARRLTARGANLALAARSEEELEQTAAECRARGGEVIVVPTDVTKKSDLKRLVARTTKELGPPDLLVNNAGVENIGRFETQDPSSIEHTIAVNLIAPEILSRLVVPSMIERRRGHIVNIASLAGKSAAPFQQVYSSSKHGLVGFSWSLRLELAEHRVGVSVICPTYVSDVGMYMASAGPEGMRNPAGLVSPDDVAAASIKAIERNRAEVVVAPALGRLADVAFAISPALGLFLLRRSGAVEFGRGRLRHVDGTD